VKNRFWSSERSRIRKKGIAGALKKPATSKAKQKVHSATKSTAKFHRNVSSKSRNRKSNPVTVAATSADDRASSSDNTYKENNAVVNTVGDGKTCIEGKIVTPVLQAQQPSDIYFLPKFEELPATIDFAYVSSPSSYSTSSSSSHDEEEIEILNECDFFEGMDDSAITEGSSLMLQPSTSITYSNEFIFGLVPEINV
jgi:hypothetical protein